jgi:hypothetical protein
MTKLVDNGKQKTLHSRLGHSVPDLEMNIYKPLNCTDEDTSDALGVMDFEKTL